MLPGLVHSADLKFAEVIRPLAAEIAPCYWLIRHQSGGPFNSLFVSQNEALFEKKRLLVMARTRAPPGHRYILPQPPA